MKITDVSTTAVRLYIARPPYTTKGLEPSGSNLQPFGLDSPILPALKTSSAW
jgi:hypothetical protein